MSVFAIEIKMTIVNRRQIIPFHVDLSQKDDRLGFISKILIVFEKIIKKPENSSTIACKFVFQP